MRRFIVTALLLTVTTTLGWAQRDPGRPGDIVNPSRCNTKVGGFSAGPIDPGAPGIYDVAVGDYDFGEEVFAIPDYDVLVEEIGRVHYPEDLACGPFPIIFMMHGDHETCFFHWAEVGEPFATNSEWPCEPECCSQMPVPMNCECGYEPIWSYRGFDYLAEVLASQGFIVVSISANAINANTSAIDDLARAHLFQRHMEIWRTFNGPGGPPFGNLFRGTVDFRRVGTLGHSRGGRGAALHVGVNEDAGTPFGLKGVFLIGPTRGGVMPEIINDVPLGIIQPYCDGDVDEFVHVGYFDDARYNLAGDSAPKFTFDVIGANHNNYNTYWDPLVFAPGSIDDWPNTYNAPPDQDLFCNLGAPGSGRLTGTEQRGTARALAGAFFRAHLRNERPFLRFLRGDSPPPPSAMTSEIYPAYHPKDALESRLVVNRFEVVENLETGTLGGTVSEDGLVRLEHCDPFDTGADYCLENMDLSPLADAAGRAPHAVWSDLKQARLAWVGFNGSLTHEIPEEWRDVSRYRALQFRGVVDFTDSLNPAKASQNFTVELTDGAGLTDSTTVAAHSAALFYPPSDIVPLSADTAIPRAIMNTVRIPLGAFNDVFLQDIVSVRFIFDQVSDGAINISDLMFADEAENLPPVVEPTVETPDLEGTGAEVLTNVGLEVTVEDDHDEGLVPVVTVYSDEDDQDSGMQQRSPDAKDIAPETLRLRSEADMNEDGRVYLILARATDLDGAVGYGCATVVVPNGPMQADLDAALAQAEDARALCTAFVAAAEGLAGLPADFFLVGDGPIIGPDQ